MHSDLAALAAAYGVATEFWDQAGAHQTVSQDTVVAVLAALGVDGSTPEAARAAIDERRLLHWRRTLPPVFVARQGDAATCWVHLPHGDGARMWVVLEDGGERHDVSQVDRWVEPVEVDGTVVGEAAFALPTDLPTGWHRIQVEVRDHEGGSSQATTVLVVTPRRLELPQALRSHRGWGFAAQLYSVRSSRSWGLGDVADLADLAAWSGHELGADFILVNPLHAASPVPPMAPSPYLPVTRRFANPIYLRVEGVPEFAYLSDGVRGSVAALAATVQVTNTSAELLERDPVWAAKRAALEVVHDVPRTPGRQAAYDEFREREGAGLDDFALWCALSDTYGEPDAWPEELADPHGEAAEAARATLAEKVEFHRWLQWVLDEQLGQAQAAATAAGMAIGVMHDLAVGVHPEGADAWALRDVLAKGVAVGAPPDMYNQMGQDWSQPPWRPDALAEAGVRAVPRHAPHGACATPAASVSTTCSGCSGSGGCRSGFPAYAGHVRAVRLRRDCSSVLMPSRRIAPAPSSSARTSAPWRPWVQVARSRSAASWARAILWFENPRGQPPVIKPTRSTGVATSRWPASPSHDLPPTAGYLRGRACADPGRARTAGDVVPRREVERAQRRPRERQAWADVLRRHAVARLGRRPRHRRGARGVRRGAAPVRGGGARRRG